MRRTLKHVHYNLECLQSAIMAGDVELAIILATRALNMIECAAIDFYHPELIQEEIDSHAKK